MSKKELIGKTIITFPVGPIVSNSDGLTPVTDLTLSGADEKAIRKYGNVTPVSISANSWAAIESMDGHYNLTLTNSNMDTYGDMGIAIQDDSKCLPYFDTVAVVTSAFWHSKYDDYPWALASVLPNSETLNAHILTLATSEALNAHIITLPTSSVLNDHIVTLPLSGHVADLPNSETLNAHILTLPSSEVLNAHILTLPLSGHVADLPSSLQVDAWFGISPTSGMVADLPNSLTVKGWIDTLPNSETLNGQIGLLPNSETLNAHIITLPTSETVNAHIITLPNSEAVGIIAGVALSNINLDHLMKTVVADSSDLTTEVADFSVLGLMIAAGGDVSAFVSSDDALQAIAEGAAGGGASTAEVQSACAQVVDDFNLNHLMKTVVADSSDLTAEVADFSVLSLLMAAGGNMSAFVSSDDSLQGISEGVAGGGASASEVQSACYDAFLGYLPSSENLKAHIDTLPTSLTLNAHIVTLPTSLTLQGHAVTLPTSETLNAHIVTLPISGSLPNSSTLADLIATLPNSLTLQAQISTLPTSLALNAHIITLPTSLTLKAHMVTLPTSETLNAHIVTLPLSGSLPSSSALADLIATLPTSETLEAQISTLPASGSIPSSSALASLIATLPSSLTLQAHVVTLPTSQNLNAHILTLPTSQTVMNAITSADVRVSSLFYTEIESGYPFIEKQRIDMAMLTGITSGGGSATLHFRSIDDTKSRLIVTVDSDGNRTAVNTLDGS